MKYHRSDINVCLKKEKNPRTEELYDGLQLSGIAVIIKRCLKHERNEENEKEK